MDEFSKNRSFSFLDFYSVTEIVVLKSLWIDFPEIGPAHRRKIKISISITTQKIEILKKYLDEFSRIRQ